MVNGSSIPKGFYWEPFQKANTSSEGFKIAPLRFIQWGNPGTWKVKECRVVWKLNGTWFSKQLSLEYFIKVKPSVLGFYSEPLRIPQRDNQGISIVSDSRYCLPGLAFQFLFIFFLVLVPDHLFLVCLCSISKRTLGTWCVKPVFYTHSTDKVRQHGRTHVKI